MRRGCLFLNNRYHDPSLGTFISVDPLVAATGEAYIYASGNPATLSDPTGLDPDTSARDRQRAEAAGGCTASSSRGAVARCTGVVSIPERGGQVSDADAVGLVPRVWGDYYWDAPPEERSPEYVIELPIDGVTYADVEWMRRNPFKAARVAAIREMIVGRDDVAGDNSAGNARQHMLLAAYLTIEFGEDQARFMLMAHENVNLNSGEVFGPLDPPRAMDLTNNELGVQVGNLAANEFGRSGWDFTTQTGGGLWNDATFTYVDRMIDQLIAGRVPVWLG